MKAPLVFRIFKKEQIYVVKQFVNDDRIIIGNGPEVHIDLGPEVSPIHCIIEKRGNQFFICDLGSENGTFKDKRLILDEPISSGDSFQIGPYNIVFFIGSQKSAEVSANVLPTVQSQKQQKPIVKSAPFKREVTDLKDYLKGGTGSCVEVIVSWRERIIDTYHFVAKGKKTLGLKGDISVPEGLAPKDWLLLNLESGVVINATSEMSIEVLRDGEIRQIKDNKYKLQQSEACFIQLINGMQLVVRFAPKSPAIVFDSPFILGSSEFIGLLAALIVTVLTGLLVSVSKPKMTRVNDDIERIAQVIFIAPPPIITKKEEKKIQQAVVLDKKNEFKNINNLVKSVQESKSLESAGQAAEIKPKDSKLKAKMFTSIKQGGAIKTGETSGANMKSKEPDLSNSGLLAAFGEGGARTKLDQVYSGAGELIGAGEKAKGVSGFNTDHRGSDLGSKFKDTGAGGAGTATQGIASIGTKGRSTGMGGYGSGAGLGNKDYVQISAGGNEESFVGSIDKEAVRRVIIAALSQFKSCYEREYRQNTSLEGKVVVVWEIHEQGIAKNARIVAEKSTINNKIVEECVRIRMLGLRFPEPPVGTWADISFPFVFHGQKF